MAPKQGQFYWIRCVAYDSTDIFIAQYQDDGVRSLRGSHWRMGTDWINHNAEDVEVIRHIPRPRRRKQ